jgi:hypothetical protein
VPAPTPAPGLPSEATGGGRELPAFLLPVSPNSQNGWGRIVAPFQSTLGNYVVKQAVIRQVKSMSMSCDQVGNLLLFKFSYQGAKESGVFVPASIVFWLLRHLPVNQDPNLQPPSAPPAINQEDWDDAITPRALSVQCRQFQDFIRMTVELDRKPNLMVLLDRTNVELMRQIMEHYRGDLIDLDA